MNTKILFSWTMSYIFSITNPSNMAPINFSCITNWGGKSIMYFFMLIKYLSKSYTEKKSPGTKKPSQFLPKENSEC